MSKFGNYIKDLRSEQQKELNELLINKCSEINECNDLDDIYNIAVEYKYQDMIKFLEHLD